MVAINASTGEPSVVATGARVQNLSRAERWVSTIGGSALIISGIGELGIGGTVWAGLGGFLLYRGYTGTCPLYTRLGISSLTPRPMRWTLEAATEVPGTPEEVYSKLQILDELPRAWKRVREARWVGDGLSRWRIALPAGRTIECEARRVEDRPGELVRWETIREDFQLAGAINFTPLMIHGGNAGEIPTGGAEEAVESTELRVDIEMLWARFKVRGLLTKLVETAGQTVAQLLLRGDLAAIRNYLEQDEEARATGEASRPPEVVSEAPQPSVH